MEAYENRKYRMEAYGNRKNATVYESVNAAVQWKH